MGHTLSVLSHHQVVHYAHAQIMGLEFSLQDSQNFQYRCTYDGCHNNFGVAVGAMTQAYGKDRHNYEHMFIAMSTHRSG